MRRRPWPARSTSCRPIGAATRTRLPPPAGDRSWPAADDLRRRPLTCQMTTYSTAADREAAVARRARPPVSRLAVSRRRAGFVFVLPVVVLEVLLLAIPIAQAVYFSFTRWDGIT